MPSPSSDTNTDLPRHRSDFDGYDAQYLGGSGSANKAENW